MREELHSLLSQLLEREKLAKITSGKATVEQNNETATFEQNVNAEVSQKDAETVFAHAEKIIARFQNKQIDKLEMIDNVEVRQKPSDVKAKYATAFFSNKKLNKVDLKESVEVTSKEDGKFSKINANSGTARSSFSTPLISFSPT